MVTSQVSNLIMRVRFPSSVLNPTFVPIHQRCNMLDEFYHPNYPEAEIHYLLKPSFPQKQGHRRGRKRRQLWTKDNRCSYCKRALKFEESTIDHKVPRSQGGKNNRENLTLACGPCNRDKGSKSEEEFLVSLEPLVEPLRNFDDLQQIFKGRPIVRI